MRISFGRTPEIHHAMALKSLANRLVAWGKATFGTPPGSGPVSAGTTPRKIAVVCHDAGFYGAQLLALHIARFMKEKLGIEVATVLLGDGPLRGDFEQVGEVIDFTEPSWRTRASPAVELARRATLKALYQRGFHYAICNATPSACLLPLLQAERFRTLMLVHELPNVLKQFGLLDVAKLIGTHADSVVFPATFVRDRFLSIADVDAAKTVIRPQGLFRPNPHAADRPAARAEVLHSLGLGGEAKIVIAAGQGDRRKGIDIFCQVAVQVVHDMPQAHFVWIGDDQTDLARDCKAWVKACAMSGNVHFVGVLQEPNLYARLAAGADLFLMTSREDPFPSVVLDAMTLGIPVIGFAGAGGFVELLQAGAGQLVPLEDSAAMAAAVAALFKDAPRAKSMGKTGRQLIQSRFQFADYVHDLLRLVGIPRPRVSVIVPNFNYARYLPARLASIIGQTYRPYEIIFLDDKSGDDSLSVAATLLAGSDIPHRIVANDVNVGCYAQWLKGVAMASGDLVWIAEADDDCDARLLEVLVSGFDDADVVLAYCQSRKIDADGHVLRPDYLDYTNDISPSKWRQTYRRRGADEITDTLAIKNTIPNASAVLMRKPNFEGIRELLLRHTSAGDWLAYVHLLESGSIFFTPEVLNSHRVHVQGITRGGNAERHFIEIMQVQEYLRARHSLTAGTVAKIESMRKFTFEYLGLNSPAIPTYLDHPALADVVRAESV